MDNFFYVLIGVAWVAYSLYSARQKAIKKQQSQGLPPRGPSQSSPLPIPGNQGGGKSLFDEIFREFTGEPRPVVTPQQVTQPVASVASRFSEPKSELNQKYEGKPEYKFTSSVSADSPYHISSNEVERHTAQQQLTKNERIARGFNLREAVIYSELLNRKYF